MGKREEWSGPETGPQWDREERDEIKNRGSSYSAIVGPAVRREKGVLEMGR